MRSVRVCCLAFRDMYSVFRESLFELSLASRVVFNILSLAPFDISETMLNGLSA